MFHPHHLVWGIVLKYLLKPVQFFLPHADPFRASEIVMSFCAVGSVAGFSHVLKRHAGIRGKDRWFWSGLLGFSGGVAFLSGQAESYLFSLCLLLWCLYFLNTRERKFVWHYQTYVALLLFCLAVLTHQKMCLMVVPLLLWFYHTDGREGVKKAFLFSLLSALICLAFYLFIYSHFIREISFTEWLFHYKARFGGRFGVWKHFISYEAWGKLGRNFLGGFFSGVFPYKIPAAAAGLVFLFPFAFLAVRDLQNVRFTNPLFAFWFLLFELFILYWFPSLRQMQVLALPPAIGLMALEVERRLVRYTPRRRQSQAPQASRQKFRFILACVIVLVAFANLFHPGPPYGFVSLKEAEHFHDDLFPQFRKGASVLLYVYSETYPYVICFAGKSRESLITLSDDKKSRERGINSVLASLSRNKPVFIHKSLLLMDDAPKRFNELLDNVSRELETDSRSLPVQTTYGDEGDPLGFIIDPDVLQSKRSKAPPTKDMKGLDEGLKELLLHARFHYSFDPREWDLK